MKQCEFIKMVDVLIMAIALFVVMFGYAEGNNGWPKKRWWAAILVLMSTIVYGLYLNETCKP